MEKLTTNKQEDRNLLSYESGNAYRNFHVVGLKDLEDKLIRRYFTGLGSRVLDVGCGYGRTTKPLKDLGYDVVGIDVVPRMIETAKQKHPETDFRLMSATHINFPDNSFDYAPFSFNGLDYIYPKSRREEALAEMHRVLKSGGKLILTSHNNATIFTRPRFSTFRTLWQTLRHGLLGSNYIMASYEGGDQVTFCRMPWLQKRDFRSAGFEVLSVVGRKYSQGIRLNLFESWPYFVLQKKI